MERITLQTKACPLTGWFLFALLDENGPMPGFKQQPADTLAESENITILCDVKGDKLYNITWLKDDQNLDLKHSYLTISAEGSLNIFNAQRRRDQGKYRCIVANSFGTVRSREAELSFPCKYFPNFYTFTLISEIS